jgi:hypothetical protein
MSRTKRPERHGDPGVTRDGRPPDENKPTTEEFTREVRRRDRRERDDDLKRQATGQADPDDTPVKPRPRRLWEFWRRW